jgi:hypothetical protein
MKKLNCNKCLCFLGEMEKGKIKKDAVILCSNCMEAYKSFESLANFDKNTSSKNVDMPEFFKDLFK